MNLINPPKISVIIFSYNFEQFIDECIQSILKQTLTPYEVIICDDHSTDGSWKIISNYGLRDPERLRVFRHDKNIGMISNCNFGFKQVRGDFISWIDGDDRWLPQKLELEWEALKRNPEAKLAYSNVYLIDGSGKRLGKWYDEKDHPPPSGDVFIQTFAKRFFKNNRNVFRNQLTYYDIFKEIGYNDFDEDLIHADWDRKIRITAKYNVVYSGQALVEYRVHGQGIHHTKAKNLYKSASYVVRKNMHLLKNHPRNEIEYVEKNIKVLLLKLANLAQITPEKIDFPNFDEILDSPDPVLINSLPKSGTNMVAKMLQLLSGFSQEDLHFGFSSIDKFKNNRNGQSDSVKIGIDFPTRANIDLIKDALKSLKPHTFATAHLPFSSILAQLLQTLRFKMLLILRDPRDVVVSHAKYVSSLPTHPLFQYYQTLNFDEQIMASIKGVENNPTMPDINQRVRSLLQWSEQPFTYTTYFEKLVGLKGGGDPKDQIDEIRNISDYLGIHLTESQIDDITGNIFGGTATFRKGKIGAWRESFNEDHIRAFNTIAGDLLDGLGYQQKQQWNGNPKTKKQIKVKQIKKEYLGNNLIFIISQPRAGSTLLQRILAGHTQIHSIAEPWIMLHPIYALKKNGFSAEYDSSLARNALDDFLSQIPEGRDLYYTALRRFSSTLYNRLNELSNKTYFLDKTPRYYYIIEELYHIFPEAKFIVLLRNPMAVLSSVLKTWFNNRPQELISSPNWADIIQGPKFIVQGMRKLNNDAIIVKYEELVSNTENVIKTICDKINLPFQDDILEYGSNIPLSGRFGDQIGVFKHNSAVTDYAEKWIENLSKPNLLDFSIKYLEELGAELVSDLGYSYKEIFAELNKKDQIITDPVNNRNLPAQTDLGKKCSTGESDELAIIEKYKAEIRNNPKNDKAHNNIAILYCRLEYNEEALFHFREASKINPENIIFKKNLADFCYTRLERTEEALEIYLNILTTKPDDIETLIAIGKIWVDTEKYDDARNLFNRVIELDPSNREAQHGLHQLKSSKKDQSPEEAASVTSVTEKDSSKKFLVSAIVSTYNSERFINGCLEDLENQTIADRLEIIVVDSGSQQNEEKIIKKFQDKYKNIRYLKTNQRETVYAAWNRGIKAATGKYITNANTDDRHRPDAFEIMVRILEENPVVGAVYAENLITDKENETFENNTARQYFNRPNFNLRQMLLFSFFGPQPMWRRSVHQRIGYFDASLSVAGDYDFFIRLTREFGALHVGEILGLYTCRSHSIENGNRGKCVSETLQVLKRYRETLPLEELYPGLKSENEPEKAIGACLADQGNCCLFGDLPDIESALTYYNRALEKGYTELQLTANLGVALWLSGKQAQGMELLQRVSDRIRPAAHNAALINKCLDKGELPQVDRFEVAEIYHPVIAAASNAIGIIIEEDRLVPVQTVEKSWSGSSMIRKLPHKTDRAAADSPHLPLVSVIVRTMNRPSFLEECLSSLCAQTLKDFEVVVINDGGVAIDNIIEKYSRWIHIQYQQHPSNKGRSAALNTGLKSARGKYVAYLDDDDRIFPDHLEILVDELETGEFRIVYSDSFEVRQEPFNGSYKTVGKRVVYSNDYDRDLLRKTNYIPILNLMHHRDCADRIGLFDENLTVLEDWDYWIRLSEHYDFKHIPKITAEYHVRADYSNATAAEAHQFPVCREKIRAKLASPPPSAEKHTQNPLVSMVILTCNQLEYTRKCLDSIFQHTQRPFELIMVDNGSTDGTVEYLESEILKERSHVRIKIIKNNENKGFAGGNNQGMAAASGDYILLLNNDVVVTPGWFDRMLACAEKRPEIGIVGPRSNYVSGPQLVEEVDYDTHTLKGLAEFSNKFVDDHASQAQQVLRVVGFCMLIKRAVIDKIGAMDNRYGLGNFEDDDFSLRAAIAGFQSWIARDCFVHHFGHRTFIGEKVDLNKSLHKNWDLFKAKWGLPADKPYGSPYGLSEIKHTRFNPSIHYHPLGSERAAMDKSNNDPKSAEALYSTILANQNSKPSKEVIEDLQRLLESYPEFALAYNDLGVLYYGNENKEKALECYERAVELDPENSNFSKNLADFYFVEMGRIEEALQIYVKILERNPQDVETLLITGHICVALKQFEDAKVFYRRVLELEPQNEAAQSNLNKLNQMDPVTPELKSPEVMYQEIQPLLNNGDPHKAISLLEKLLQSYPDFALAHNDLGVLYYHTGEKENSRRHYERAVELMPANINFQKNLADFLFVEEAKVKEALQIYVNILATHPDDVETLLITAHICVVLKKFDDAKDFYERVLALAPDNEDASKNLQALNSRQIGQPPASAASFKEVTVSGSKIESTDINSEESENQDADRKETASIVISLDGIQNRIKECVKSIQASTEDPFELLLVDRGATKGMLKWAQQLAKDNDHCHIMECACQEGQAEILNRAIQKAGGAIIVLMHNDAVVPADWLKGFKTCFKLEPNIGVVGPMSNQAAGIQQLMQSDASERIEFESDAEAFHEKNRYRRVATQKLAGFCLAFRPDLPDAIGYFDERFVSEEMMVEDFCNRATAAGYQNLIAADTYVFHYDRHKARKNVLPENSVSGKDRKIFNEKWNDSQNPEAKEFQTVSFLTKANELSQKGQIDHAVQILLNAIGIQPEEKRIYLKLAEILLAVKRFLDAKDALSEMPLENGGPEINKILLLGYAEEGLGNYDAAKACAEQLLAMDPTHARGLNLKGILAYRSNDRNSAEKYFKRSIASDPGYGESYTNLAMLKMEAEQAEEALAHFEKGFILSPTDLDIATNYHAFIEGFGDFERAENVARQAADLYPHNQKIKYMLIDFLVQQGKNDMAMPEIEDAIVRFGIDDGILAAALKVREKLGPMTVKKSSKTVPVSLCMIIKDEEKYLARCLASAKPIVDEIILVDTGSADRSKDIAIAFGAQVYDYEWKDDFAATRNFSLSKASGEWILILDGDEVISPLDYDSFNKIVTKKPRAAVAYSIITRNYNKLPNIVGWVPNDGQYPDEEAAIGWLPSEKVRLFYGKDQIRFEGAVHEMVDPVLKREGIEVKKCSVQVHHYGRLDQEKLDRKGEIYFDIGHKKLSEKGEDMNALRELAIQATILEKNQEAYELWQRLLALNPNLKLAAIAYVNMGTIYSRMEKFEEALDVGKKAVACDPDLKEAHYNHAMAELHCGNAQNAISILESLLTGFPDYPPAQFILSAAYCCGDQKEKGIDGIRKLKNTPMGAHLHIPCVELGQSLLAAKKVQYAVWVLGAAIECDMVSKEILDLFNECIKMNDKAQELTEIPLTGIEDRQVVKFQDLPQ